MNTKNLILTSTLGMSREQWLAFRHPLNHIKKFIHDHWFPMEKCFFHTSEKFYEDLKKYFELNVDWKEYNFPCLGSSEISVIMGLNPYQSNVELYFEKIGVKEMYEEDNVAMFWGKQLEAAIAEKWQYWNGSPEGLIENYNKENVLRRCRRVNAYCQNKAFPWLFCSIDRVINKNQGKEEGYLECKTISGYAANMWENGIPPMYVAQLQTGIGIYEFSFGEIAILKDGRYFEVYPFDQHLGIIQRLIDNGKLFHDLVKQGAREFLLYSACPDENQKALHYAELERLAPEPDGSEAYKNYLTERYKDGGLEVNGGILELELAKQYKFHANKIDIHKAYQMENSNRLKAFMKEAAVLNFGEEGNCSWRANKEGSRVFRVNVKNSDDYIPEAFKIVKPTIEEKVLDHNKKERKAKKEKIV